MVLPSAKHNGMAHSLHSPHSLTGLRTGQTELLELLKNAPPLPAITTPATSPSQSATAGGTNARKARSSFWGMKRITYSKKSSEDVTKERPLSKKKPKPSLIRSGSVVVDSSMKQHRRAASGGAIHVAPRSLRDRFASVCSLALPKRKLLKRGHDREEVQHFIAAVSDFLVCVHNKNPDSLVSATDCSWPRVFHQRMLMCLNLLSDKRLEHLRNVAEGFLLATITDDETEAASYTYARSLAQSLLEFLDSHTLDPENALMGMTPADDILAFYTSEVPLLLRANGELHPDTKRVPHVVDHVVDFSARSLSKQDLTLFIHDCRFKVDEKTATPEELMKNIVEMSNLLQSEDVVARLWGTTKLKKGDLVLVVLQDEAGPASISAEGRKFRFLYARYSGKKIGNSLLVYLTPDEVMRVKISIYAVLPFTMEMKQKLGSTQYIQQLVANPAVVIYQEIIAYVRDRMLELLASREVDIDRLKLWVDFDVEVGDLQTIKQVRSTLCSLRDDPPFEFLREVEEHCAEKVETFMATSNMAEIFTLSRDKSLKMLFELKVQDVLTSGLRRYVQYCDSVLDYLQLQTQLLVNGTKKQEITEWWLSLIDVRVTEFLESYGYDFSALPDNYILCPPQNMDAVRENLRMIRCILNQDDNNYPVQQLISDLQAQIYPKIDLFVRNACTALADTLGISAGDFTIEKAEARFKHLQEEEKLDEQQEMWIDDLLKDVIYLNKVKELEERPKGEGSFGDNLDIVPMSGIIMGTFYRYENELGTALEVWDVPMEETLSPPQSPRTHQRSSSLDFVDLDLRAEERQPTKSWAQSPSFISRRPSVDLSSSGPAALSFTARTRSPSTSVEGMRIGSQRTRPLLSRTTEQAVSGSLSSSAPVKASEEKKEDENKATDDKPGENTNDTKSGDKIEEKVCKEKVEESDKSGDGATAKKAVVPEVVDPKKVENLAEGTSTGEADQREAGVPAE